MSIGNVTFFSPWSLAKRNSQYIVGSPFWLKLLSLYNLHPPASLRQLPLGSQSRLSTGEDLKMAARIERPFQTLLDDCGVCNDFQTFLRESTLVTRLGFWRRSIGASTKTSSQRIATMGLVRVFLNW